MERITISISDEFAAELQTFMEDYHYGNRSKAICDLARLGLERARVDHSVDGHCLAAHSYVYDHLSCAPAASGDSHAHDHAHPMD